MYVKSAPITGRKIRWDAKKERILDDKEASKLLTREYRKPYVISNQV